MPIFSDDDSLALFREMAKLKAAINIIAVRAAPIMIFLLRMVNPFLKILKYKVLIGCYIEFSSPFFIKPYLA